MISGQDESTLARWASAPPTSSVHADVLAALIAIGDALRRGVEIPKSLRDWMKGLTQADAEIALEAIALDEEISAECRDDADAARRAVLRIAMANGWPLMAMTSIERLGHAVKRFDAANANATSRAKRDAIPGDDVVLAYVSRGALARYVEDVAQQNPTFGEELAACIDALAEVGPQPSIASAARRWRANWPPQKKESSPAKEERGTAPARQPTKIVHVAARRIWPMVFAATVLLAVGGSLAYRQNQIQNG